MKSSTDYKPPKVWTWEDKSKNKFSSINRPTAGAIKEKKLPVGKHPLQLYSLGTPNGVKVTILLEELLSLGFSEAEYDAHLINIMEGDQFGNEFVKINPNSKIPALIDQSTTPKIRIFESGSILVYLSEKFSHFLPTKIQQRAECFSWVFWQMASTPYLGGGFGHFYAYAPEKNEYCIDRYTIEVKRQLDVLNRNLKDRKYLCGEEYTLSDIATYPWYGSLVIGDLYHAQDFLEVKKYEHVIRWAERIKERPAVKRGERVNRVWGKKEERVYERHDANDISNI
jgi:GST-like protein